MELFLADNRRRRFDAALGGTFEQWLPSSSVIGATGLIVGVIGLLLLSQRSFRTI